jgi:hypothetical protein
MTVPRPLFVRRPPPEPRSLETIAADSQDARERSRALRAAATRLLRDSRLLRVDSNQLRKTAHVAP